MRATNILLLITTTGLATGCAIATDGSRGVTRSQLSGQTSLVFTNATPDTMCSLRIHTEGDQTFGDNWLPTQLPSGKSINLTIKPGTYMATWNTCKQGARPYHAGTLAGEHAFTIKDGRDATQLFAYIADTVAPTKRAAPCDFHTLVKFQGQTIGAPETTPDTTETLAAIPTASKPFAAKITAMTPRTADSSMAAFIDPAAVKGRKVKFKPALVRKHDVSDRRVGYAERKQR